MKLNKYKVLLFGILFMTAILRFWKLDSVPASLFGDEVDVGYQAYSIFKTGKDYMGNFLPIHFRSLADFRTPLYLYSSVPTVAAFGVSPWGVRLPAAVFGLLGVLFLYLLIQYATKDTRLALIASLLLAISPWHLQYSRAGFEVTELLFLLIAGIYFFLKSFKNQKLLIVSAFLLALTPWAYNTAKLFLPIILLGLTLMWHKELVAVSRKILIASIILFLIIVTPFAYSTIFGGGTERFNYVSIFSDPTMGPEIGFARLRDNKMGSVGSHIFHNKVWSLAQKFSTNYLQSFSPEFLFIKGDINPRHSIGSLGEFYKFEFIFLIMGLIFFFDKSTLDKKFKSFILFWLLTAPIPSALTIDGGNHATRLILMLPPSIFLISHGIYRSFQILTGRVFYQRIFVWGTGIVIFLSLVFYLHDYYIHYPWDSERWWHSGYREAITSVVSQGEKYDKVIISDADEPSLIFFLGWSEFSPVEFQKSLPLQTVDLGKIGNSTKVEKYYFTPQGSKQDLYKLGSILPEDSIYLAVAKEIGPNLIEEPDRLPKDLKLLKSIAYPSGEPAFYLFAKK